MGRFLVDQPLQVELVVRNQDGDAVIVTRAMTLRPGETLTVEGGFTITYPDGGLRLDLV